MSGLNRRRLLEMFGVLAASGAAGACGTPTLADEETDLSSSGRRIRIGLLYPYDGPDKAIGADINHGFGAYLEGSGRRLGAHDVDILTADEGVTPETARAAAEKLVGQQVVAIVGGANSVAVTALREVVEKAHVPFVGTNGSPSDLTSVYYMWRVSYVDGEAGRALAPRVRRDHRSAYLLADDTPACRDEATNFRSVFTQLGGKIIGDVVAPDRFVGRLQAAQNSSASAIFAAYGGRAAGEVIAAYRSAGISKPIFGPGSLTEGLNPATLMEGSLPSKIYTSMNYATNLDNEENRRFVAQYRRIAQGRPTAYAMAAYDAAGVIDGALRAIGGDPTAVGLNNGFSRLGQIDSPRGIWAFTINRTPQQHWYLRRLRRDGQVPANLADEDLELPS